MLELLDLQPLTVEVFNFSQRQLEDVDVAISMGLTREDLDDIKPSAGVGPPRRTRFPSRFTNGDHQVFYTSFDLQTCEAEVRHHVPLIAASTGGGAPTDYHYYGTLWKFSGEAIDLRNQTVNLPDIEHLEDYTLCQAIGSEAVARNIDALIVRSVRHLPDGINLPVFALNRAILLGEEGHLVITHP